MVRSGICAVVLAVWSGAGVADGCLVAADLAQGIAVNTASGAVVTTKMTYHRSRPTSEAGKSWTGTVKTWDQSAATGILQTPTTSQYQATCQFLAETVVTWGGCRYRIIPVETQLVSTEKSVLHFDGVDQAPLAADIGQGHEKRRLLYFPDLGFAVVTKIEPTARSSYSFANGLTGLERTGG